MNKKVIALLYWGNKIGGISSSMPSLIKKLIKDRSLEVHVLLKRKKYSPVIVADNLTYHYFSQNLYRGRRIQFFFWLCKNLFIIKPDYVVTFLNRFGLIGVLYKFLSEFFQKRPRVIIYQPIVTSVYLKQYESLYWNFLTKIIFRHADGIITNSKAVTADLHNHFFIALPKLHCILNWIPEMKTDGNKKKQYDCIFVGRLSPEKGIETLLDTAGYCASKSKNFSLAIVGDGSLKERMLESIDTRGLTPFVHYLGYQQKPYRFIQQSRLLLLPSFNEGLPMVILEAYSMGIPAAITPFIGCHEAVEQNKTGIITKRAQYPQAIYKLLQNRQKLQQMGVNARNKAKKDFSMKNLDRFVETIFNA